MVSYGYYNESYWKHTNIHTESTVRPASKYFHMNRFCSHKSITKVNVFIWIHTGMELDIPLHEWKLEKNWQGKIVWTGGGTTNLYLAPIQSNLRPKFANSILNPGPKIAFQSLNLLVRGANAKTLFQLFANFSSDTRVCIKPGETP